MSDLKRLFKRDRFYWGIMLVVMTLAVIYMLTKVYGSYNILFNKEDYLEHSQYLRELWNDYPNLFELPGIYSEEIPYVALEHLVSMTVLAALLAQAVRLLVQETKNRTEVLRIFPVKSYNLLTCHYLSGLLMAGIPLLMEAVIIRMNILYIEKNTDFIFSNKEQLWIYVGKAMIIFMLHYSLLVFCKKVTNHVPGTIFTYIVANIAMEILAAYCLDIYYNMAEDSIRSWTFWVIETVVLIILSYIADRKKDCARNGFYAFPIVHWVMIGAVFGEIYFMVGGALDDIWAVAVSILITAGVHFIAKPKN